MDAGVTINRPPRDGRMAFVRTPDNISIELLQKGGALPRRGAVGVDGRISANGDGWPDRRFLDAGRDAGIRSSRRRWPARAASSLRGGDRGAARSARCPARCSRPTRCARRSLRSAPRAGGPLNLNFFCHPMPEASDDSAWRALLRPYYEEFGVEPGQRRRAAPAVRRGDVRASSKRSQPEVVSFHFGLPDPSLARSGEGERRNDHRQRHERRGSALAGGARRRRHHRPGLRGGRPCRALP